MTVAATFTATPVPVSHRRSYAECSSSDFRSRPRLAWAPEAAQVATAPRAANRKTSRRASQAKSGMSSTTDCRGAAAFLPDGEITETPTRSQARSAIVQPPPLPPPAPMPPEGICGLLPLDG
jgi:hypothetical protein